MLTKPRAELLYLGRHPPLKKLGFLHGPGCTETTLAMCLLTQGFDLIASQQDKGENYHQSYCNPYGSLLPVNAFPNGESTDFGDSGEGQEDSVFSGGTPLHASGLGSCCQRMTQHLHSRCPLPPTAVGGVTGAK